MELTDAELIAEVRAGCTLAKTPGKKDSWIEAVHGELPEYVCIVARAIMRSGHSTSSAIAIALSRIKVWATGKGVDADTQAKAIKALAQWTALKAKAKRSTDMEFREAFDALYERLDNVA